jgi:hypothetical protein
MLRGGRINATHRPYHTCSAEATEACRGGGAAKLNSREAIAKATTTRAHLRTPDMEAKPVAVPI